MTDEPKLWSEEEIPEYKRKYRDKNFKSLRHPVWTYNKAKLISTYLQLFLFITKHGTYIDGFAAPQDDRHLDGWAAKRVLELEPKWLREFWLCDISTKGIGRLNDLKREHETTKRLVNVVHGDFNKHVGRILRRSKITEKVASFALLDQRTFECYWDTAKQISEYKKSGNKIEIFYFFPSGWLNRSLAGLKREESIRGAFEWWGRDDWKTLRSMDVQHRARLVADRFEQELGYESAKVYAIHNRAEGGRIMYHMIHATDHEEAPQLMIRAYRKVSGRRELPESEYQMDLGELFGQ